LMHMLMAANGTSRPKSMSALMSVVRAIADIEVKGIYFRFWTHFDRY
jgi:hypothetical protein